MLQKGFRSHACLFFLAEQWCVPMLEQEESRFHLQSSLGFTMACLHCCSRPTSCNTKEVFPTAKFISNGTPSLHKDNIVQSRKHMELDEGMHEGNLLTPSQDDSKPVTEMV